MKLTLSVDVDQYKLTQITRLEATNFETIKLQNSWYKLIKIIIIIRCLLANTLRALCKDIKLIFFQIFKYKSSCEKKRENVLLFKLRSK